MEKLNFYWKTHGKSPCVHGKIMGKLAISMAMASAPIQSGTKAKTLDEFANLAGAGRTQ